MIIYPAIDIKEGKVVRLRQGKFDDITEYSDDPVEMAKAWKRKGAEWLHVVDLDGALTGEMQNYDIVIKIAETVNIPVQAGGGIRQKEDIDKLFSHGVQRVVLGTKVIENRIFLKEIVNKWKDRIIVSLDCANGLLTQRGWTSMTDLKATVFAQEIENLGLKSLIYTDIAQDGTLQGPNFKGIEEILRAVSIPVIASGGVSSMNDLRRLYELHGRGLRGVIMGKAIYEGKVDLAEAIRVCSPND